MRDIYKVVKDQNHTNFNLLSTRNSDIISLKMNKEIFDRDNTNNIYIFYRNKRHKN